MKKVNRFIALMAIIFFMILLVQKLYAAPNSQSIMIQINNSKQETNKINKSKHKKMKLNPKVKTPMLMVSKKKYPTKIIYSTVSARPATPPQAPFVLNLAIVAPTPRPLQIEASPSPSTSTSISNAAYSNNDKDFYKKTNSSATLASFPNSSSSYNNDSYSATSNKTNQNLPSLKSSVQLSDLVDKKEKKPYTANWSLGFYAQHSETLLAEQDSGFQGFFKVKLDYELTPWLKTKFTPVISYKSGYLQVNPEGNTKQGASLSVSRATLDLLPSPWFNSILGIQNLLEYHSGLLVGLSSWPAVTTVLQFQPVKEFQFGLRGTGAITQSATTNKNEEGEIEGTPSFASGGAFLKIDSEYFSAKSSVSYFQFSNLPNSIAKDNAGSGNSTVDIDETGKEVSFFNDFQGIEAQLGLAIKYMGHSIGVDLAGIRNELAPTEYNEGYSSNFYYDAVLSKSFQMTPYYEISRIEPDAAISSLNLKNTNRYAQELGIDFTINKKFKIGLAGQDREIIFIRKGQSREKTVYFKMETLDALF